jgi:hypothetical protein
MCHATSHREQHRLAMCTRDQEPGTTFWHVRVCRYMSSRRKGALERPAEPSEVNPTEPPFRRVFPALGSIVSTAAIPVCAVARISRVDVRKESPDDRIHVVLADLKHTVACARRDIKPFDSTSATLADRTKAAALAEELDEDGHMSVCFVCNRGGQLILCTTCFQCSHLRCTSPPTETIPSDHWRCDTCLDRPDARVCGANWLADLQEVLGSIAGVDTHSFFKVPVARTFISPGYTDSIQHPIDLQTMTMKAKRGCYAAVAEVSSDISLMVANCVKFNEKTDAALVSYAGKYGADAHRLLRQWAKRREKDLARRVISDYVAAFCATGSTVVPAPVLWPSHEHMAFEAKIRVSAASAYHHAVMCYTLDGSEPNIDSRQWPVDGLVLVGTVTLKLKAFVTSSRRAASSGDVRESATTTATYYVYTTAVVASTPEAPTTDRPAVSQTSTVAATSSLVRRPAEKRARVASAKGTDPAVWAAFLSVLDDADGLSSDEKSVYRLVSCAATYQDAQRSGVHPEDVRRVQRDFDVFCAINSDLIE